jgi:hypothetical protein
MTIILTAIIIFGSLMITKISPVFLINIKEDLLD